MTPLYLVGLDLGQANDPSALAIAERRVERWGHLQQQHYLVRHLERFPLGTPYGGRCLHGQPPPFPCPSCPRGVSLGGIVEQVNARLRALPVPESWVRAVPPPGRATVPFPNAAPHYTFLLDATGVGRGVADMFKSGTVEPICVTITAGDAVTEHAWDTWHVAKRQLVSHFQVFLKTRCLHVLETEEGRLLMKEGTNFQYRLRPTTGEDHYGAWREGTHDDLLMAVALLTWWGETFPALLPATDLLPQTHADGGGHPLFHEVR